MASDQAEYMRGWRRSLSGQAATMAQRRREKARRAAIADLIENHQGEFDVLFSQHLRRVEAEAATG
jgi:hypothetical protein